MWSIFSSQLKRLQWSQLSVSHLKNKNSLPRISTLDWFDLTKKTDPCEPNSYGGRFIFKWCFNCTQCLLSLLWLCNRFDSPTGQPASLSLGATLWQIFPQEHFDFQFLTFETCLDSTSSMFSFTFSKFSKKLLANINIPNPGSDNNTKCFDGLGCIEISEKWWVATFLLKIFS